MLLDRGERSSASKSPNCSSGTCCAVRPHAECNRDNDISKKHKKKNYVNNPSPLRKSRTYFYLRPYQHSTLKVIRLPVLNQVDHDHDRHEQNDGDKTVEIERHRLPQDPAQEDEQRRDEERDVQDAADDGPDHHVDLPPAGYRHQGRVFCRVSSQGNEYQTQECQGDVQRFGGGVDAVDQVRGADE